jgi:hypothetical protein
MAKTKKRSFASAAIPKSAIEQVGSTLKDLPAKPKENLSLREAVSELHDSITMALARGYSYDEVVEILAGQGVEITVASLKRYLAVARKEASETPKRTRRGTRSRNAQLAQQAETLSSTAASRNGSSNGAATTATLEMESIDSSEPAAPKKRHRAGSRSNTTPKTKTAAKAKPTSRAKTTSRSTSSRSRRKSNGASN